MISREKKFTCSQLLRAQSLRKSGRSFGKPCSTTLTSTVNTSCAAATSAQGLTSLSCKIPRRFSAKLELSSDSTGSRTWIRKQYQFMFRFTNKRILTYSDRKNHPIRLKMVCCYTFVLTSRRQSNSSCQLSAERVDDRAPQFTDRRGRGTAQADHAQRDRGGQAPCRTILNLMCINEKDNASVASRLDLLHV